MTDNPKHALETPEPTAADEEKAFRQHMAFNVEAMRAGLFAAAMDMAETMKQNEVPHADAILTTAAVEFSTQLWTQVMLQAGIAPEKIIYNLEKQVRTFYRKHLRTANNPKPTQQ